MAKIVRGGPIKYVPPAGESARNARRSGGAVKSTKAKAGGAASRGAGGSSTSGT